MYKCQITFSIYVHHQTKGGLTTVKSCHYYCFSQEVVNNFASKEGLGYLFDFVPLVGVIFDSVGDFGLSLYDDTESMSFYKHKYS